MIAKFFRIISVIICFSSIYTLSAQVRQVGVVVEINSNGKTVSGASIEAVSSDDVQPAVSGNDGVFILNFAKKKKGDVVYNLRVYKSGYEVVNTRQINDGVVLTDRDTLKIVLAPPAKLAEARANYYEIFDNYQVGVYKRQVEGLKKQLAGKEITLAEYEERVRVAENDLKNANSKIADYADRFSRINKDDMDSVSRHAFNALDNGDIEGALKVYSDFNSLERLSLKIDQRNEANASISELIPGMYEEIELRMLVGGKENRRIVGQMYDKIVESDTTNALYIHDAVRFFGDEMDFDRVIGYGRMAERNSDRQFALASIFIYLGRAYMEAKDFDKSRLYFEKSMAIIDAEKKKGMDEKFYLHKMNYPLHALGMMYYNACEYKDAEQTFRKAIEVRRRLSEIDSAYDDEYANSLSALSVILCDQLKYDEAMAAIDEAITVLRRTYQNDPKEFATLFAHFHTLKGNICMEMDDFAMAKEVYAEALSIYGDTDLPKGEYRLYMYANRQFAKAEWLLKEYDEAAVVCERVVRFYTDNNDKGVLDVDLELAEVLYGNVLYRKKDYESSIIHFETAKDIMEKSCGKVMKLRKDLPNCYACIGMTYLAMNDKEKAENAYLNAYAKAKELYDEDHDGHHELFEKVCVEMSKFYRRIGKKRMAKRYERIGEKVSR